MPAFVVAISIVLLSVMVGICASHIHVFGVSVYWISVGIGFIIAAFVMMFED